MTDLLSDVDAPSDAELISRVRGGDVAAYGDLFRRHKDAAGRLARQLVRGPDSDDLVAEAFAKVLTVVQGGGGPDVAFRAYLLTAVRRLHVDRVRIGQRLQTTDDMTPFDPGVPFQDTAVAGFESGAAAKAFASLPERWQLVLWHLEVEGQKPAEIAPLLGMSANSVSALAYRAREGLRQAFLTMHLSDISETDCRWVNEHLGAYVRNGLSKRDAGKVRGHLDGCRRCTAMHLELTEVNSNLAGIIAPLLLGAAATGYLASAGAGIGAGGLLGLLGRAKDFAAANTGAVATGAVAAGVAVAAVATVVVTQLGGNDKAPVAADPPAGVTSSVPVGPGAPSASASAAASGSATASASASASVSASTSPSVSASASPSSSTSASTSPSGSLTPGTSPSPGLALLPGLPTLDVPTDAPTGAPTDGTTGVPTDAPTDAPTDGTTDTPTDVPTTAPPTPGTPSVRALNVNDGGTVDIAVADVGTGDVVTIAMAADETTFGAVAPSGCSRNVDADTVTCLPVSAGAGRFAAATPGDYAVTLPLEFPGSMVDDDLTITVSVNGQQISEAGRHAFHPSRPPSFDFAIGPLAAEHHTVADDVDRYDVPTTASLPRRVHGLRYRIAAPARFRSQAPAGCSTSDDATTLSCPDAADGARITLPVAADALTAAAIPEVTVSPVVAFHDPTPENDSAPLALSPGADLSLPDLAVFSANPDRNGLVELRGTLSGARTGMAGVTYSLLGPATFPDGRNRGCTTDQGGSALTCPDAGNGPVDLVVRPTDRHAVSEITVDASPRPPFESVGSDHATTLTLPGRKTHDFAFSDLQVTSHTVSAQTDTYELTGRVGGLPAGVDTVDLAVDGADVAATQGDSRCTPVTVDGQVALRCTGLGSDPTTISLTVTASSTSTHPVTVSVLATDPFDDPDPDPTPDSDSVTVSPGSDLTLTTPPGAVSRGKDKNYLVPVVLGGVRPDLPYVTLSIGPGATFAADQPGAACTRLDDSQLRCDDPADGNLQVAVVAGDPEHATPLVLTALPGGDFEQLGDGNVARPTLQASHDFTLGALTESDHSVSGDTDRYTLDTTVGDLPPGLGPVTLALTGGRFPVQQPGCDRLDDTHVTCGGGPVDLVVESDSTTAHKVSLTLQTPAGYDDPSAGNDTSTTQVQPGVDLSLTRLDPDNESPANDDRLHRVATTLGGTRTGLGQVTYTLTGAATFVGADVAGCAADGKTLACTDPHDGRVTFTVRADDVHAETPISIAVGAPAPFVELDTSDNVEHVKLLARPTYDFAMGDLQDHGHTVSGDTDHYTLRSAVAAVPKGLSGLTFELTGGTFATGQDAGCTRDDATHITCRDLGSDRDVDFRVDSTSGDAHDVGLSLQVPRGYDDPDGSDNSRSILVKPGIDLRLGALTPADPVPGSHGTFTVATTLTGVRSGPVQLTVEGATVTASSCTRTSGSLVTCASPAEGQQISLTLTSPHPTQAVPVTVTANAAERYTEVTPGDNHAATTLAPDVRLDSLTVRGDGNGDRGRVASVRAQVSGVPAGMSSLRFRITGADAGLGAGQVHFTEGYDGANGQGIVSCYTSDADGKVLSNGLYATCKELDRDADGAFFVDMQLTHQHGRSSNVTLQLLPLGVDEGAHGANNSRALTLD